MQYINRFYRRTGSLWEDRYKSGVVQARAYFLACCTTSELNPVRADMVADPASAMVKLSRQRMGQPKCRITAYPLYLAQGKTADVPRPIAASSACTSIAEAAADIRQTAATGMPVGNDRLPAICAKVFGRNSGKRGGPAGG